MELHRKALAPLLKHRDFFAKHALALLAVGWAAALLPIAAPALAPIAIAVAVVAFSGAIAGAVANHSQHAAYVPPQIIAEQALAPDMTPEMEMGKEQIQSTEHNNYFTDKLAKESAAGKELDDLGFV